MYYDLSWILHMRRYIEGDGKCRNNAIFLVID